MENKQRVKMTKISMLQTFSMWLLYALNGNIDLDAPFIAWLSYPIAAAAFILPAWFGFLLAVDVAENELDLIEHTISIHIPIHAICWLANLCYLSGVSE